MFEVRCEGCQAPFEVDERRVPKNGMRMRCPKCGASFTVRKPDGADAPALPAVQRPTGQTPLPVPTDITALPAPHPGSVGLPQRRSAAPPPPARSPVSSAAQDNASLPVPADLAVGLPTLRHGPAISDVGLPAVAGQTALPAVSAGLPQPADHAALPVPAGETGLPSVSAGLPSVSAGLPSVSAGLPSVSAALPMTAAGLPMNAAGLPMTPAGLPMNAAGLPTADVRTTHPMGSVETPSFTLDEADVPMADTPKAKAKLTPPPLLLAEEPDPVVPSREPEAGGTPAREGMKLGRIGLERRAFTVSSDADLPQTAASSGVGLPTAVAPSRSVRGARRDEVDLSGATGPSRSPQGSIPRLATSGEFGAVGASIEAPSRAAGGGFGDIELGGDAPGAPVPTPPSPVSAPLTTSFPQSDVNVGRTSDAGGEFDSIPGVKGRTPLANQAPVAVAKPKFGPSGFADLRQADRIPTITQRLSRTQRVLYGSLAVVAVLVIGGASLAATSYGAFGKNFFDERVNGPTRHAAAARVIAYVNHTLEQDTYDTAVQALRRLDQAEARVPAEKDLKAYIVYANDLVVARFGADPARTSRAHTLLGQIAEYPEDTKYLRLARAADALARGDNLAALRALRAEPEGRDLATLAAQAIGDTTQTLRLARQARQRLASPRARYLLARAEWAAGDSAAARSECEGLLRVEPRHAGGRILLARLLGNSEADQVRALDLVRGLVDDRPASARGRTPAPAGGTVSVASPAERAEANVVAGHIELARDHVTAAQARFQRALELDPRSAEALVGLGDILFRQGSFTDAQARFRNAFSAEHNNIDAAIGIAESCLALNQPADARAAIEPVVHDHPDDPRLHYWLGKALASGEHTRALQEFRQAIRLQPTKLEPYVALSELLIQMNRTPDAEQVLNDARAQVPDGAALHRALAHGRYASGDLRGAETELLTALQRDPEDLRAHFMLGEVYRRMQRLDQAEHEFSVVAQADADYPGLALARGQLDEARGQLPQALNTFREALARDPTNVELIVRVASTNVLLGNFDIADQALRSVVVDHPTNAEAQYILGRARLGEDNYTDAVRYLDRAIELNPQRADYKAFGAEAHRQVGDITNALRLAQQSIDLDPNIPRGYWVRAEITVHHGDAVQALADVRHATALDPRFWPAYATWGDVDESIGHPQQAIVLYRMATEHDPTHGDWYYTLGRLLSDAGNEADARVAFQHAIDIGAHLANRPTWYTQALRLEGDSQRDRNPVEARRLYTEWLRLVAPTTPGYSEIQNLVMELGNH